MKTAGRLRLLYGGFADKVKEAINVAELNNLPVEIMNSDYQVIGYIVSKEYLNKVNLKDG